MLASKMVDTLSAKSCLQQSVIERLTGLSCGSVHTMVHIFSQALLCFGRLRFQRPRAGVSVLRRNPGAKL